MSPARFVDAAANQFTVRLIGGPSEPGRIRRRPAPFCEGLLMEPNGGRDQHGDCHSDCKRGDQHDNGLLLWNPIRFGRSTPRRPPRFRNGALGRRKLWGLKVPAISVSVPGNCTDTATRNM